MIKTFTYLMTFLAAIVLLTSCRESADQMTKGTVNFSVKELTKAASGGRVQETTDVTPAALVISAHDANGKMLFEHSKIELTAFGSGYTSTPVLFDVSAQQNFYLSEFFVLDKNDNVIYATPREGSDLAHLVNDPLDIEFTVTSNNVTTVTPEVLAVDNSSPTAFGYAEFGFDVVNKIEVILSAFIQGSNGNQLTDGHVKVEGLQDSTSTSPLILWTYETDFTAKANLIALKTSPAYRITVTKQGYTAEPKVMGLKQSTNVNIFLTQLTNVDVYSLGVVVVGGKSVWGIWKNGVRMPIPSNDPGFHPNGGMYIQNGDIYMTGTKDGVTNAFYMKNDERIDFPFDGVTSSISFEGNDLYVLGHYQDAGQSTDLPFYVKNNVRVNLPVQTPGLDTYADHFSVDGSDIYFSGNEVSATAIGSTHPFHPLMWKNGQVIALPHPPAQQVQTTDIKAKNGHVYVTATLDANLLDSQSDRIPGYWLDNGTFTPLTTNPSGISFCEGVEVTDTGDVYFLGFDGRYWKNGQEVKIPGNVPNVYQFAVVNDKVYATGNARGVDEQGKSIVVSANWIDGEISTFNGFLVPRTIQVLVH